MISSSGSDRDPRSEHENFKNLPSGHCSSVNVNDFRAFNEIRAGLSWPPPIGPADQTSDIFFPIINTARRTDIKN